MADSIDQIINDFYSEFDKKAFGPETVRKGARHIQEVLDGLDPNKEVEEEMGKMDMDGVSQAGVVSEGAAGGGNSIETFFQNKSIQEKNHFLKTIVTDDTINPKKLGIDLKEELAKTQKALQARTHCLSTFMKEAEKNPLPEPQQLLANKALAPLKDVLEILVQAAQAISAAQEPTQDVIEEFIESMRKKERSKSGLQILVKYLYKYAKKPGVKKYLSTRFGALRQEEEPDFFALTEANISEFKTFAGL